jgi:hypothetical protein
MPIESTGLKTKIRNSGYGVPQNALKNIKSGAEVVSEVIITKNAAVLFNTQSRTGIPMGVLKEEYLAFIQDLENPKIEFKVTGGEIAIYDERKQIIREVGSLDELSLGDQEMIKEGFWSFNKKRYGCNLSISK